MIVLISMWCPLAILTSSSQPKFLIARTAGTTELGKIHNMQALNHNIFLVNLTLVGWLS